MLEKDRCRNFLYGIIEDIPTQTHYEMMRRCAQISISCIYDIITNEEKKELTEKVMNQYYDKMKGK